MHANSPSKSIPAKKDKTKIEAILPKTEVVESKSQMSFDATLEETALIEKYMPYATSVAAKMAQGLPAEVDFDDLICNARVGLLEAARRYDVKFGVEFRTFAYYRIKGAIYDGLRKTGWVPRSMYTRIKFEQAANAYLESHDNRHDTTSEFYSKELAKMPDQDSVNAVASVYVMSMDSMENFDIEDDEARRVLEHKTEFQKIKELVCDAIEGLPDKERKLIKMYYFQNKTMEEIGEALSLSKSWTSRLHARGLELLYKKVSAIGQAVAS